MSPFSPKVFPGMINIPNFNKWLANDIELNPFGIFAQIKNVAFDLKKSIFTMNTIFIINYYQLLKLSITKNKNRGKIWTL